MNDFFYKALLSLAQKLSRSMKRDLICTLDHVMAGVKEANLHILFLWAAMNISGLVNYRSIVGSFNNNEFCQFLREAFRIREVVESQGHRIVFIPPYSLLLNPIELLFSNWKHIIKSGMSIFDGNTLLTTISADSTQISGDYCAGWIREATRFASRTLQRESF
ncbi:hypothetical protein RF11_04982 [Thelohanellus kitauei]|uniref:Tc1-like transposase DDE domain-containing protein n=1 Tax=Thelohanellus kitauei TaxID=669202 RepID=A0A0C2NDS5_THEKT|nr:hypothetical protein RF11_04982 [Thelohanellus kitauei]